MLVIELPYNHCKTANSAKFKKEFKIPKYDVLIELVDLKYRTEKYVAIKTTQKSNSG